MALLSNENDLRSWLAPKLEIIVEEIMKGIDELNDEKIEEIVYSYDPDMYVRTPEGKNFKSAWGIKHLNNSSSECKAQGEFGYQPEKMMTNPVEFQHGNAYTTYPNAYDSRWYLAHIIYGGISGKYGVPAGDWFGYGPWTEERDAWNALIKAIGKTRMRKWIKAGARKAGLKIKFNN